MWGMGVERDRTNGNARLEPPALRVEEDPRRFHGILIVEHDASVVHPSLEICAVSPQKHKVPVEEVTRQRPCPASRARGGMFYDGLLYFFVRYLG